MKPATYISVYVFVYIIEVCQSQEILPLIFNFRSFAYFFLLFKFCFWCGNGKKFKQEEDTCRHSKKKKKK